MAEREIKTILTLEDASFSKGLKAASSGVKAAQAEMNAAISSADGLGKGFKKSIAQVKGLSNVIKAQKTQMGVLSKEYGKQQKELNKLGIALEKAKQLNGEGSKEAQAATNAYAAQSAKVNDLRVKMADLETQMNRNKDALKTKLTAPLRAAGSMLATFGKLAVGALAVGAAALVKFTADSNESKKNFNLALADSRGTFGAWSLFLEEEAKKAWQSLGLSQAAYMETAAEIGQKLQEGGASVQQSAEWVTQAMELAGQLSDNYGVPIETVLADISKAAEGEKGALRRYGITVQGVNDKMTKSEAASAILKEAMKSAESTALALDGNVAQSVNSAGEKLSAAWENFKAGVGSSEDVASAAAEAASAFGADFAENLGTFIQIAPGTFSSFANAFKLGWKKTVWPKIQDLFHEQFGIDLPDWDEIGKTLQKGWEDIKRDLDFTFGIKLVGSGNEEIAKENVETVTGAMETLSKSNESLESKVDALESVVSSEAGRFLSSGMRTAIKNLDKTDSAQIDKLYDTAMDQYSRVLAAEKIAANWEPAKLTLEDLNQVIGQLDDAVKSNDFDKFWDVSDKLVENEQIMNLLTQEQRDYLNGDGDGMWNDWEENYQGHFQDILNTLTQAGTEMQTQLSEGGSSLSEASESAASSMQAAGAGAQSAASAFNSAAASLSGGPGFAGGLWNVPHNNFMASLHSGEMVLTAAQAARYRAQAAAGGSVNNYNDSSAIYIDKYYQRSETDAQALLNAMSVMQRRQRRGYGMA